MRIVHVDYFHELNRKIIWRIRSESVHRHAYVMPINGPKSKVSKQHGSGTVKRLIDMRLEPSLLSLHQATRPDALWKAIIRLIHDALPCHHIAAEFSSENEKQLISKTTLLDHDSNDFWVTVPTQLPMFDVATKNPRTKLVDLGKSHTEYEVTKSRFYQKVMIPHGWRHLVSLLFWNGDRFSARLSIGRTTEQECFSSRDKKLLLALHPHFEAAIQRVAIIERQESVFSLLREELERPSDGLVLLNAQGQMMFQNHAAALACAIWKDGRAADAIQLPAGKMIEPPPDLLDRARKLFSKFIEESRIKSPGGGHYEFEMHHQDGEAVSARVRIVAPKRRPVPPHVRIEFSRVVNSTPAKTPGLPVHRLSEREHRVALLVARGLRNQDVATELGLSVNTVRAHLREVFSKLGVGHRGQLSAVLHTMEAGEIDYSV